MNGILDGNFDFLNFWQLRTPYWDALCIVDRRSTTQVINGMLTHEITQPFYMNPGTMAKVLCIQKTSGFGPDSGFFRIF